MESYIVRFVRRDKDNPELIAGTVEDVETQERIGFNSFDRLREILSSGEGSYKSDVLEMI